MAKNPVRLAEIFIQELTNDGSTQAFEYLDTLLEELENKIDPSPTEIYLIENIYHFVEKFKVLENNIRSYVRNSKEVLPGNILSRLYEDAENDYLRDIEG